MITSMKKYWIYSLVFCVTQLMGQQKYQEISFYYEANDAMIEGAVEVAIEQNFMGSQPNKIFMPNESNELTLNYGELEEGGMSIKFRNVTWNASKGKHLRNELIIKSTNFRNLQGLEPLRTKDVILKTGQNEETLRFKVEENATGNFRIPFIIKTHKGEIKKAFNSSQTADGTFTQFYSIIVGAQESFNEEFLAESEEIIEIEESDESIVNKKKSTKATTTKTPSPSAKQKTEISFWKETLKKNNLKAYRSYCRKYPNGRNWKVAQNKIDTLQWTKAQYIHKTSAYENYLRQAPNGAFRSFAKSKIDDRLWEIANEKGELNAYDDYQKYSESFRQKFDGKYEAKYIEEAKQKSLAIDPFIQRKGNNFVITLEYAEPPIDEENIQFSNSNYVRDIMIENNKIILDVADNASINISVTDALNKKVQFVIDNTAQPLKASIKTDDNHLIFYNVVGGEAPYYAQLKKTGESFKHLYPLGKGDYFELSKETLSNDGLQGNYTVQFMDERKSEAVTFNGIEIQRPERSIFAPLLFGLLLLLGGLFYFITQRKQNQRKAQEAAEIENKLKEKSNKQKSFVIKKKEELALNGSANGKHHKGLQLNKNKYFKIDLEKIWKDTAISDLFLHQKCIQDLDEFVREQNNKTMAEEVDTPEIGGFLLGNYDYQDQADQYEVALEKFVPITPNEQGVYKIEFGSKAWAELAEVQEEHEDLEVIGWFHTHPGHGLFLSKPDMRIQDGFFRKKYQLAMEIDPLTEDMDTTFFSRKQAGKMNNKEDRKENTKWLKWVEIDKWTRKKKV